MVRQWLIFSMVAWLVTTAGSAAFAQSVSSGTIHGTIKDESGAVLPGVSATLTSPALQVGQLSEVTDASGDYRFVDLPPGTYRLKVERNRFSSSCRGDPPLTRA